MFMTFSQAEQSLASRPASEFVIPSAPGWFCTFQDEQAPSASTWFQAAKSASGHCRWRRAFENRFLTQWCEQAYETGVRQLQKGAKTLLAHRSGILGWWQRPINNGRMEGTHNIKTLNCQAMATAMRSFLFSNSWDFTNASTHLPDETKQCGQVTRLALSSGY